MDHRERILDAAIKQFAAHGYRRTTLERVAAEVGLGTTALYYYFKNKMELFHAVVEREGSGIMAELEGAVEKKRDPGQQLRAFCLTRFRIMADKFEFFHITERVYQEILEMIHSIQLSVHQREAALLEKIIRQGIQEGFFRKVNVPLLVALLQQVFRQLETPHGYFANRKEIERRVDFALDILFQGLESHHSH